MKPERQQGRVSSRNATEANSAPKRCTVGQRRPKKILHFFGDEVGRRVLQTAISEHYETIVMLFVFFSVVLFFAYRLCKMQQLQLL